MANYNNTVLLNALTLLKEKANKDFRAPAYGATQAFNDRKRDVIDNYDAFINADESGLRTLQVDYLRRNSQALGTSRSASLTGAYGTSTRDSLTFVTYTREFSVSDDNARTNTFRHAKQLAAQIENARLDIGAGIETAAITKLEAFKNTVQGSRTLGAWDGVNYLMTVANADEDRYFNYVENGMQMLDYNGAIQLINFGALNELKSWQIAQGAANSSNLNFQYGNKKFYTSNSISNSSDHIGTTYAIEDNSLALVDWIPGKNRGSGLMGHATWDFTNIPDPFGIFDRMALAVQPKVTNTSGTGTAVGGNTQDAVWLYELSVDIAFYIPTITTQKLVNKYVLSKT
jgi:hypothetical protein